MKLLCLCDSPTASSGFARVTQNLLKHWRSKFSEIHVWGINYHGYPHHLPYKIYPAGSVGGEWCRPDRLSAFLNLLASGDFTHVWLMQDTFALSSFDFPKYLRDVCDKKNIKSFLYFPVDAPIEPQWAQIISAVDVAVAYTEYGRGEALAVLPPEFDKEILVLPHGCDTDLYRPLPNREATRAQLFQLEFLKPGDFLMLNVAAHQRRKDVYSSFQILKRLQERGVPARLCLHMPDKSADGVELLAVARQLDLQPGHDWVCTDEFFKLGHAVAGESELVKLYNAADLFLTTTLGEGWGLPITEALGCGCPVAVPAHTACKEIVQTIEEKGMEDRALLLPVSSHGRVMPHDNSRVRYPVHLDYSVEMIEAFWRTTLSRPDYPRPELNAPVKQWLGWRRIAFDWTKLF